MILFNQRPAAANSGNLLSTTKVRLYHDAAGRATLHPKPIVHERCPETQSTVHQQPLEITSPTVRRPAFSRAQSAEGAILQTFEQGDLQARELAAVYAASPAGILEAAAKAALETKWAVVTKTTAWNQSSHVSPSTASAAEALLKSLGF